MGYSMRNYTPLLYMTAILVIAVGYVDCFTDADKKKITHGLEVGKSIADVLTSGKFKESLKEIASSISSYLGVIGPFASLVLAFIPKAESAELQYMKKMMENIDNRFDRLGHRFGDIERLIKWNTKVINFGAIEQNIVAMTNQYEHLYKVPQSALANRQRLFITAYNNIYEDSGSKLYNGVVKNTNIVGDNICTSVLQYTKYNRKQTQLFLLGIMQLFIKAIKIEVTYLQLMHYDENAKYMVGKWTDRLKEVRQKFEQADNMCEKMYRSQSGDEIDRYSTDNKDQSNENFANGLFKELAEKYYWRDWLVIVYNPLHGWSKHTVSTCGGHVKFRSNGRNIVVASVDKQTPTMNLQQARSAMTTTRVTNGWDFWGHTIQRAPREINDSLNTRADVCATAVIKCNSDIHYKYGSSRFAHVNRCPYFELSMWG